MTRDEMKKAFADFLICREAYPAVLTRRSMNTARACFCDLCEDRSSPDRHTRSMAILWDIAEQVKGRIE